MVYRKRRTTRRARPFSSTARKGRWTTAKRGMLPRSLGTFRSPKYHYKQIVDGSLLSGGYVNAGAWTPSRIITQSATQAFNFGFEFTAGDMSQWAFFAGLYDQYRINKIVFRLVPQANVNILGSGDSSGTDISSPATVLSVIDYDNGSTTLSTLSEYEEYANCKMSPVVRAKSITRIWRPRVNIGALAAGGANVGAVNKGKQWIDCGQSTISHHGIKFYIPMAPNAQALQAWSVFATYYISFRAVR